MRAVRATSIFFLFAYVEGLYDGGKAELGQERIFSGSTVVAGEFPYLVSVTVDGGHVCGGFIYNNLWVITAASCVDNVTVSHVKVITGRLFLNNPDPNEKIYGVFKAVIYPEYNNSTKLHDIAMLEMTTTFPLDENANCILYGDLETTPDTATIMGWGATFGDGTEPSSRLRQGEITTLNANCSASGYPSTEFNRNYMICAGADQEPTPCLFDEGGPLVQENEFGTVAVGIFSKNLGCESGKPSIYTRLAPYYAWFSKNAQYQPTAICIN